MNVASAVTIPMWKRKPIGRGSQKEGFQVNLGKHKLQEREVFVKKHNKLAEPSEPRGRNCGGDHKRAKKRGEMNPKKTAL